MEHQLTAVLAVLVVLLAIAALGGKVLRSKAPFAAQSPDFETPGGCRRAGGGPCGENLYDAPRIYSCLQNASRGVLGRWNSEGRCAAYCRASEDGGCAVVCR